MPPFDVPQFKKGTPQQRATMAADIVRKQSYLGKPTDDVLRDLGQGDLPERRENAEYMLEEAGTGWRNGADYYLEFSDVDKDKRVKSIYVIQRCCKNPYASYWHNRLFKLQ
jgi:hypothetical protein